jgi:conjugative transfer region lipoprotein (TIGR03751 family)
MSRPHWINALGALLILSGCTTDKEHLLSTGSAEMRDIWHLQTGRDAAAVPSSLDAHRVVRRIPDARPNAATRLFPRLPNPDLVMYVFPHLSGGSTPVPGYSTVFPLFQHIHYAMPGDRTEQY